MPDNIDYYNIHAEEFYNNTVDADMSYWIQKFENMLPVGAHILDAGCGSGRDSLRFKQDGYNVIAFDASEEMCRMASELINQSVLKLIFEEIDFEDTFDGVWACASLLHVEEQNLLSVLCKIFNALKNGGVFYASFKYGKGHTRRGDRFFIDLDEITAPKLFAEAGFDVIICEISEDVRSDRSSEKWINIIAKKQ